MRKVIHVSVCQGDYGPVSQISISPVGRSCKACKLKLSTYNPNPYCFACIREFRAEIKTFRQTPHYTKRKRSKTSIQSDREHILSNWDATKTVEENCVFLKVSRERIDGFVFRYKLRFKRLK